MQKFAEQQIITRGAMARIAPTLLNVTTPLSSIKCQNVSLGFALSCALGSVYGFLQGAWPFGVVEAIWALVAVRRWWRGRN